MGGLTWKVITYSESDFTGLVELPRVDWARGFPHRVHCRLSDVCAEYVGETTADPTVTQMYHRSRWRPTPWALAVCRHHPVTVFVVSDRHPCNRLSNITHPFPDRCAAWDSPAAGLPLSHRVHWLPKPVLDLMDKTEFDTPDAALAPMFLALGRWVRSFAHAKSAAAPA